MHVTFTETVDKVERTAVRITLGFVALTALVLAIWIHDIRQPEPHPPASQHTIGSTMPPGH